MTQQASSPRSQKSQRLVTTTPATSVGAALHSIKPQISPKLFQGLEIQKVSSNGVIAPRILTISDDLFTLFVSHHKVGSSSGESLSDRFHYKGFKAYAGLVKLTTGTTVQAKRHLRVIDVTDILFVQSGYIGSRKLEACKEKNVDLDGRKVISVFHNNMNTTDFLVEDEADRKALLDAIRIIREAYNASKVRVGREELLLRYAWYDTDWDKSGLVDKEEFLQLLARINIYLKQEKAVQIFKAFVTAKHTKNRRVLGMGSSTKRQGLTFDDCLHVLRRIKADQNDGDELMHNVIFDEIFGAGNHVASAEDFLTKFLHDRQKEKDATIDDVRNMFSELNSMEISGAEKILDEDGEGGSKTIDRTRFGEYLSSRRNDLYDLERQKYDPLTLDRPMSEYWINSSHNTYLTGDQLKSLSSVEMYVLALQRGCKCLELDCWDDSVGYPIIYHGYTITSKIPFQDVINCVKGYIDANPDTLPIILSLENHCSHPFQEQMANILQDTLEDRLYMPDSSDHWPSPLDLVGKVVIKGKRPPEKDDDDADTSSLISRTESNDSDELADQIAGAVGKTSTLLKAVSKDSSENADPPPPPKIFPELSKLTLLNGVKFKSFDSSVDLPLTDMHSINETKILKILNSNPENAKLWKQYNRGHMTRTYPAGSRVDSSNYSPVLPWHVGSQLVALNFQTDDSCMTINDGRFRENGGCGYVLKPPSVLSTDEEHSSGTLSLRIKVLSGSCLPKPYGESVGEVIDPYVVVSVHDVEQIKTKRSNAMSMRSTHNDTIQREWLETATERKTSSIRDNGFCPQWNDDSGDFWFTVNSEAAVVEFVVMDSDKGFIDDCMCKSAVPVSCLRQGLRSVQFYDQSSSQHGPFGFARILVDVDIKHIV